MYFILWVDLSFLFAEVNVPVVGGHAGITILPLFSQVRIASFSLFPLYQTVWLCKLNLNVTYGFCGAFWL